jgi:MerR family transcriptional regulator, heat shock protein HspR
MCYTRVSATIRCDFTPTLLFYTLGTSIKPKSKMILRYRVKVNIMKMRRKKGFFSISAVAKMFSVHQQTVRLYEKQGLISPKRSSGNTRLFSEEDIDQLEEVIYLTHEMGINLAGVEMILRLKKQIKKMQSDMNKIFDTTQQELEQENEKSKEIVQSSYQRLLQLKNKDSKTTKPADTTPHPKESAPDDGTLDIDNWEIEYEDD